MNQTSTCDLMNSFASSWRLHESNGTVSKLALGNLQRDGVERIWAFPRVLIIVLKWMNYQALVNRSLWPNFQRKCWSDDMWTVFDHGGFNLLVSDAGSAGLAICKQYLIIVLFCLFQLPNITANINSLTAFLSSNVSGTLQNVRCSFARRWRG